MGHLHTSRPLFMLFPIRNVPTFSRSLAGSSTLSTSAIPLWGCLHYAPHCTVRWLAPAHTSLPREHLLSAPEQTQSWQRFLKGCSAAAEGRASPSSGSYIAVGPDQGWPPGTAGRRAGRRESRHRRSGRSSQSGGRAGPGEAGKGMRPGADRHSHLASLLTH